jgi:hypothetical protein
MRCFRFAGPITFRRLGGLALLLAAGLPAAALDKPTGAPLVLSSIETEQGVPLAVISPDGKNVSCVTVRVHWNPRQEVGPNDEATSFDLDIPPDSPGAAIFTAQLWNASLASALAWQQPWQGARWKILDTPATDGTGIDAALAVGMISTAARRPYPKDTLVIGGLRPDGSLGAVPRLEERLEAAATAGITRVIIPSIQRFDTDASGDVVNMVRRAGDLHLDCVPVDNLVQATEAVMNDPLPDVTIDASTPHYSNDIAGYIDDFAQHEQFEAKSDLTFAPREADLARYPARLAGLWHTVFADTDAAAQAYRAGQVYVAYRLFARASGRMHGLNALVTQDGQPFDVKSALTEADDLRRQLHDMFTPPAIDKDELESALLVAEMSDWAYDLSAQLEGAELATKQTYSQRSDATPAERDRAREEIVIANEEVKYLLKEADFFTGLLSHVSANPIPVEQNATNLLPQLIPAQLADAEIFTEGIRPRAGELREGLLFDSRLVAYIEVLRETQSTWNARQRHRAFATTPVAAPAEASTRLNTAAGGDVAFDPGNTYAPPHTYIAPNSSDKKISDVASCLIWVNNDCEIAALDEKYLRLGGTIDPATHEWHLKDRARLDALLQMAETGARQGISFAEKAEVDTSVLTMIYEKAAQLRIQGDDASALDALRNFWRCALLGNMCWQLAHAPKAQPVDVAAAPKKNDDKSDKDKTGDKADASTGDKTDDKPKDQASSPPAATPAATAAGNAPSAASPATNVATNPAPPPAAEPVATPATVAAQAAAPAASGGDDTSHAPRALPVDLTDSGSTNSAAAPAQAAAAVTNSAPPVIPVAPPAAATTTGGGDADLNSIPVAPVARTQDYSPDASTNAAPTTNAPATGPVAPSP